MTGIFGTCAKKLNARLSEEIGPGEAGDWVRRSFTIRRTVGWEMSMLIRVDGMEETMFWAGGSWEWLV
jgi:hypothetical protein